MWLIYLNILQILSPPPPQKKKHLNFSLEIDRMQSLDRLSVSRTNPKTEPQ